ncbi:MAG TPA: GDSL-type esterase/lipase family protein [Lysobacter sp.]
MPDYKKPKTVEPTFQGEGDADRSSTGAIDLTLTFHERIAWPGSDTWASFTPDLSSSVISGKNLTNDGYFYGDFIAAEGGMEINTTFDDVVCTRACIIRHTGGVMMFYCQQDGNGTITQKNLGAAATTLSTGITWAGKADHVSWLPSNSEFTIRLYDLRTWSVLLNGREIIPPQTLPAGHFITLAGFGIAWDGANVAGAQRYWTKVVSQHSSGRGFLDVIVVGDSTSADVHGAYPDFLRNYLDGSFGYNVQQVRNYAQDGATSAIQLATLTANGVSGATDVIVNVGTNDVQNPGAAGDLTACLANVQSIINLCAANNKRCTGVIFPTWYNKAHSGNKGVTTFNYELSALYRSAYRHRFAMNGCQIVDLNMELRSPLGSDVGNTFIDPALRDNIHWTPRRAMAAAWAIARKIAGYTPKKTRALPQISLPTSLLKNSWVINGAAGIALDTNALVTLTGRIDGGTKVDGTQIMLLPANMAPKVQQVYRARSDAGNAVTVIIATTGSVTCFGVGADAGIHLDGISFYTN